ncbi:hypothetical protein Dsin_019851 [Dipteronia sinensis]|uniref:RNase H type-1 domain-containing protein n=1 Tax=Dipteronia sinensis TaxID=43782 RepID=A0AAE0A8C1_9ROSI|nr:hypothetical protein Dsin_019851 [Dipteronia sinensis]
MFSLFHILTTKVLELLCVIFWRTWYWRNQVLHSPNRLGDEDVISWSISFLEDFRLAQGKISSTSPSIGSVFVKWCKLDVGFYKINIDAAINVEADLLPTMLESDATGVVEAINHIRPSYADIRIINGDIVGVMSEFSISVSYISRKANKATHALVKLALLTERNFLWKEDYPPCINVVIMEDSLP